MRSVAAGGLEPPQVSNKNIGVRGGLKILVIALAVLVAVLLVHGWLDDRVEWLCDGIWVEKRDGSTECIEGATP